MKIGRALLAIILILLITGESQVLILSAQETNQAMADASADQAFDAINNAMQAGANVTNLVPEFNAGLLSEQNGNYDNAISTFNSVATQALELQKIALSKQLFVTEKTVASAIAVSLIIAAVSYIALKLWRKSNDDSIMEMEIRRTKNVEI